MVISWKSLIFRNNRKSGYRMMEIPEGKVSLLDAVPVRCGHITTEWEGECAVLATHGLNTNGCVVFLLPKGMSPDIHVRWKNTVQLSGI